MIFLKYLKIIYRDKGLKKARIFFLRSFLYLKNVNQWLSFIDEFYQKFGLKNAPAELVVLPVRSYVCGKFNIRTRMNYLMSHYSQMTKFFSKNSIEEFLKNQNGVEISNIEKKTGEKCYLKILMHGKFWREGATTIYFSDEKHEYISSLTFTIGLNQDKKIILFIGGLQGGSDLEKSDIVAFTRSLGGLRPKHALIECCYAIANCVNADSIIGVSNENHVFSYQRNFQRSYNDIWNEIEGVVNSQKNFLLPKSLKKRDFAEVPQKKRKDWLIRHAHLEKLNNDICKFLIYKSPLS